MEIQSKMIVHTAKRIIKRLYMLLGGKSTRLVVTADISELAKDMNITGEQVRLSLHYLKEMGYVSIVSDGSVEEPFNIDDNNIVDLGIHPGVIDRLEENRVFK